MMTAWWDSLDVILQVLWVIALSSSLVFIIQAVLTFLGMDSDSGLDSGVDFDDAADHAGPFQLFTFRNFINFLLGFSWAAIVFYQSITSTFLLALVATLFGALLVSIVMFIFYKMAQLAQTGNISISDTQGLRGTVYLTIKEHRSRSGKVQLSVKGAVREYDAFTDGETLHPGQMVVVEQVLDGNVLLVSKF